LTNDEALDVFRQTGALLKGHFLLSSGRHSDTYLEKFRLVERPALLEPMCQDLADRFRADSVELVLGPTTAGIILAYCVARHLGVESRYAEKDEGIRQLRRGQRLAPGTRVLVVDDILTTGGAIRECIEVVQRHEAILVGVGVLGDRSGGVTEFGARLESLLKVTAEAWPPASCPLCERGVPITKPGTSAVLGG
jgi:orotate phosphoribosyltransferase